MGSRVLCGLLSGLRKGKEVRIMFFSASSNVLDGWVIVWEGNLRWQGTRASKWQCREGIAATHSSGSLGQVDKVEQGGCNYRCQLEPCHRKNFQETSGCLCLWDYYNNLIRATQKMQIYGTYFVFGIYELLELGAIGGNFHLSLLRIYVTISNIALNCVF